MTTSVATPPVSIPICPMVEGVFPAKEGQRLLHPAEGGVSRFARIGIASPAQGAPSTALVGATVVLRVVAASLGSMLVRTIRIP